MTRQEVRAKVLAGIARNEKTRTLTFDTPRDRWEWALKAHREGMADAEIAERLGVSKQRAGQLRKKAVYLADKPHAGIKKTAPRTIRR